MTTLMNRSVILLYYADHLTEMMGEDRLVPEVLATGIVTSRLRMLFVSSDSDSIPSASVSTNTS